MKYRPDYPKTVRKALEELLKIPVDVERLYNPRHRPDLICLPDSTLSAVATERFGESGALVELENILIIEVKRADKALTRTDIQQAEGYVEDLAGSGLIDGRPYITAFVVGERFDKTIKLTRKRTLGDSSAPTGHVEACTFDQLIRTARLRLFSLRERLEERYEDIPDLKLVNQVLSEPKQKSMFAP